MLDAYLNEIVAVLERGQFDRYEFEVAVVECLRADYPGIVPMPGGKDQGHDGTVPDNDGPSYPLITTSSPRFVENLRKSLTSYLKGGHSRRRCLFATSQEVRPPRKKELEEVARELGFELVQVFDRHGLAPRFYNKPALTRRVLGVSAAPPLLSKVPVGQTPGRELIGREKSLIFVQTRGTDKLLVGPSGSGKTALFAAYVESTDDAYFVVGLDRQKLSEELRERRPGVVILEDVDGHAELANLCIELRSQLDFHFDLIASAWTDRVDFRTRLKIWDTAVHHLELLTRPQILEVLQREKLASLHDGLLAELMDQAEGRPGLAVTLARLVGSDNLREVVLRAALRRFTVDHFERIYGGSVLPTLGWLALAGKAGIELEKIAEILGESKPTLYNHLLGLQLGGLVALEPHDRLSLRPPALRPVLVGEVFLSGLRLPWLPYLGELDLHSTLSVLIEVQSLGTRVPQLRELMQRNRSIEVFVSYAWLGPEELASVLTTHPDLLTDLAGPGLKHNPELLIPRLLSAAIGDERPLSQNPDHPFRLLDDWVGVVVPNHPAGLARRRYLFRAARDWSLNGGDVSVGLRAMCLALRPDFHSSQPDPALGTRITVRWGLLSPDELRCLGALWLELGVFLRDSGTKKWASVFEALERWLGSTAPSQPTLEQREAIQAGLSLAVKDLVQVAPGPGARRRLVGLASQLGVTLDVESDPEYEILFPETRQRMRDSKSIQSLALHWLQKSPEEAAEKLKELCAQAAAAGAGPGRVFELGMYLARLLPRPLEWLLRFECVNPDGHFLSPILEQAARTDAPEWQDHALQFVQRGFLVESCFSLALRCPARGELLEWALGEAPRRSETVNELALQNQIPEELLETLLRHSDQTVRQAVAFGLWEGSNQVINGSLAAVWREVVLEPPPVGLRLQLHSTAEYALQKILTKNVDLAEEWLIRRMASDNPPEFGVRLLDRIGAAFTQEQRLRLIPHLRGDFWHADFARAIVGNDTSAFQRLLERRAELPTVVLVPLRGKPDSAWSDRARVAVRAGILPERIASEAYITMMKWVGEESTWWRSWLNSFAAFQSDSELLQVARAGMKMAARVESAALERERLEAVYGTER